MTEENTQAKQRAETPPAKKLNDPSIRPSPLILTTQKRRTSLRQEYTIPPLEVPPNSIPFVTRPWCAINGGKGTPLPRQPRKEIQSLLWTVPFGYRPEDGTFTVTDELLQTHLTRLYAQIQRFRERYSCTLEEITQLAPMKKKAILQHLGSFCRCRDWPSINKMLSPRSYERFLNKLLETVLVKQCYEKVISNPFFYVTPSVAVGDAGGSSWSFGAELRGLYEMLLRANPAKAHEWRQTLTHLLQADYHGGSDDWRVAFAASESLEAACQSFAQSMLGQCEAFRVLLRDSADSEGSDERCRDLVEIFRVAAELSVGFAARKDGFVFHLDAEHVPHTVALMRERVVTKSGAWRGVEAFKGRRPVLVRHPLIERSVLVGEAQVSDRGRCREEWRKANEHSFDSEEELNRRLDLHMPMFSVGDSHLTPVYHGDYLFVKE
ncbi:hypothetical protein ASPACDRAFT_1891526 [Aspergillus aculeatus ATCC 16872]|uniref:Uncharacterized protein n=1 Tax=Aspergillus aculeatus (strain ATCC 16872 / CBS 172.66 / WB 5094) TaxID=690307 RepID=A0A1L9WHR1_ASPA1|nr:uncharacterized protein ASPACDRAFT_1891526 [Aspergillus aculeatus ATCC 16872]OJJ95686.1 hypothetical protein ASPACDRAFT_1891526 [Aspergillus aculeatus ATCC 16872]